MSTPFEVIQTADIEWVNGLPYSRNYQDIYFTNLGHEAFHENHALHEAQHIFINGNHLIERWRALPKQGSASFVIGETGFGTGLNFLLAWSTWARHAPPHARLHYVSCEKHPFSKSDLQQVLALWPELASYAEALLLAYPVLTPGFHRLEWENGRVTLDLMLGDALTVYESRLLCGSQSLERELRVDYVDAWFLDGFSPQKNPDMWSDKLCWVMSLLSREGTTLSTFSVARMVKDSLQKAGFALKKRPGYGKKRDMLVGTWQRTAPLRPNPIRRVTPWQVGYPHSSLHQRAIVLGAGLAGCCVAEALVKRGFRVTVLEQGSAVGLGASGNQRAILFPNLSAYRSPLTELMLSGFLFAHRYYQAFADEGQFKGMLQWITSGKTAGTQADFAQWLDAYPALGRFVDKDEASELAGVSLDVPAIYIPMAGWIDSPTLCHQLIQHPHIELMLNTTADSIEQDTSGCWHVAGQQAEVLVIANGYDAHRFSQTQYLSIKPLAGQMTGIQASEQSLGLQIPLCGDGHILPAADGVHAIGATFRLKSTEAQCMAEDDEENRQKINDMPAKLQLSQNIVSQWAGVRGAAHDHLPIVGPVARASKFQQQYSALVKNINQWVGMGGAFHAGLYIAAGFGARGVTSIPLCANYLAGSIAKEPSALPKHLVKAISPARFLLRGHAKPSVILKTHD
jgi:tRNA 5-methylaminomethyl-2-thiouridine biosynthesis bifunctional protein